MASRSAKAEQPGYAAPPPKSASPAEVAPGWLHRPWAKSLAVWLVLLAAVALVYQPAWHGGFVWDDALHLLNNPVLKPGGLASTWLSPGSYIQYWPLTFTAYRLQYEMWGLNPLGYHLVNIALHALSAMLVWRILLMLRIPGALFAAGLFALHPVNVESVAWISQLKDILALMLALVSVLYYLSHEQRGGWWRLAVAVVFFALSTLAKGEMLTLGLVLLACAWWQRGAIGWGDLLRVRPYILIGVLMTFTEVFTHRLGDPTAIVRSDSLLGRTAVAGCAVWFYLWKLVWPVNLVFVYPRWSIEASDVLPWVPGFLLAIILAVGWWQRRSWGRPVAMVVVCYVALLLPVLGFVDIYFMEYSLVADHWQYAAMIVPCAAFAAAAATLGRRWRLNRTVLVALALALLAVLAVLSWRQSRMYKDIETLYRTTIERNPGAWMVHNNLGNLLARAGRLDEAIREYEEVLRLRPDFSDANNNLGIALARAGRMPEAIERYQDALRRWPDNPLTHYNLGNALVKAGRIEEAVREYREALRIWPDYPEAHNNLGNVLAATGRAEEAAAQYREVVRLRPGNPSAHNSLGSVLLKTGRASEAVREFQEALRLKPDLDDARRNLDAARQMLP